MKEGGEARTSLGGANVPGHPGMGPLLVILASEGDRRLRIPLLFVAALVVLYWVWHVVYRTWGRLDLRKAESRQLEEWTAVARARGFVVEMGGEEWTAQARARGYDMVTPGSSPVMRGTIAGRPFELDGYNFFAYGMDAENALRFRVEDVGAALSIRGGIVGPVDDLQPATGDEEFDKHYHVRANPEGLKRFARFGPMERRLFLESREYWIDQGDGEVRIRMPYKIDLEHLDSVSRLIESVWGPPSKAKSEA